MENPNWKEIFKIVEERLYEYPILKVAIENEKELEKEGLSNWLPSMTPVYEEKTSPSYSEYCSTTEKYGILRAYRHIKIRQIERSLTLLKPFERKYIEAKYFDAAQPSDTDVAMEINMCRATLCEKVKKPALKKIARALNLC